MPHVVTRRTLLAGAPAGLAFFTLLGLDERVMASDQPESAGSGARAVFPSTEPDIARRAVGFSHANLAGLRELVDRRPELAKASYDWGFGDWETCIGAASHVGNREIAEYLLSNGATPTIFTAAMLGQLDAVKAEIAARPGIQRTLGPHGITLLKHATAGGEESKAVADYLTELGDADKGYEPAPLSEEQETACAGVYTFGPGENDRLTFERKRMGFSVERAGRSANRLFHVGSLEFHPTGAPGVRCRFTLDGSKAASVAFFAPDLLLTARRVEG